MQALVIVEDGNIITSAPYHYGEWGTVDESELETCTSVAGGITLLGRVPSFRAFDGIQYVGGNIRFDEVEDLDDVDGFPVLEEIGGSLWFTQDSDRIEEVSGFPLLHTVGELNFRAPVTRVTGLGALEEVRGGAMLIPAPRDRSGMRSLRTTGNFELWNGGMTDLSPLDSVEVIQGRLVLLRLRRISDPGFAGLSEVDATWTWRRTQSSLQWTAWLRLSEWAAHSLSETTERCRA